MISPSQFTAMNRPIRIGMVGTGHGAKARAEALKGCEGGLLVAIAGHTPEKTEEFSQIFQTEVSPSWGQLLEREELDLAIVSSINKEHGAMVRAALENNLHVVVEYPLCLDPAEAAELIASSKAKNKLLHVEHIELLGGLHNAVKKWLPAIGKVFYARYKTISPKHPAPRRWSYQPSLFGFPFVGALSRLHRFTDLFGEVAAVSCESQFWQRSEDFYKACLCNARLKFTNGIIGECVYGKGETFWQRENMFAIYGSEGTLIFTPKEGQLIKGDKTEIIEVGSRRGLFAKDTTMVLEHLQVGTPLYVTPQASLYALKVADATRRSAENNGEWVFIDK